MNLSKYDNKLIRVIGRWGEVFVGFSKSHSVDFGICEFGRDEDSIKIGDYLVFEEDIEKIDILRKKAL